MFLFVYWFILGFFLSRDCVDISWIPLRRFV